MAQLTSLLDILTAVPISGLQLLPFGKTPQDTLLLLGTPKEDLVMQEDILNQKHRVLYFKEPELRLFFDLNNNSKLSSFECTHTAFTLHTEAVFKLDEKAFSAFMKTIGYALSESEQTTWGEKLLAFDDAGIDAYFENKRLVNIQCSDV